MAKGTGVVAHVGGRDRIIRHQFAEGLERLNKQIERCTNVVGIFPDAPAIRLLVGAPMINERAFSRRRMTLQTVATVCQDQALDPPKTAAP